MRSFAVNLITMTLLFSEGLSAENKPESVIKATILIDTFELEAELFADKAPTMVSNFVELARKGYYNGTYVYDVIGGLAIEMGSTRKSGDTNAGYTIDDEFGKGLDFSSAGTMAYTSTGPDMNSSQFLINLVPTPHFQDKYPIFGRIVNGEQVLKDLVEKYDPKKKFKITEVKILDEKFTPIKFTKRTPFSTDDIKSLTESKAKLLFVDLFKIEKLGKLRDIELKYKSIRGRKVQVAYEAITDKDHRAKIILLGKLTDTDIALDQFQYQQIKSMKPKK